MEKINVLLITIMSTIVDSVLLIVVFIMLLISLTSLFIPVSKKKAIG